MLTMHSNRLEVPERYAQKCQQMKVAFGFNSQTINK